MQVFLSRVGRADRFETLLIHSPAVIAGKFARFPISDQFALELRRYQGAILWVPSDEFSRCDIVRNKTKI